ncbi:MAG: HEAT repeat domain-containing protein [Planctomycetia bacterium]|nr:HEAT repeat domain-containing protein [Planctomycetia bacterium]
MNEPTRRGLTADDALPPVEPPNAAFLVQLFVVPLTIVACGLFVVWGFYWLAQMGNDPESYVRALRRNNEGRWQVALNFANDLRGPGGAALKGDAKLAADLAGILDDEVASGRTQGSGHAAEQSKTLCGYLCRALGEFSVPEAAVPLLKRANDTADSQTAQAAVEALAVLASNLAAAGKSFDDPAAVTKAILAASQSENKTLRSSATFALGVIGGPGASERLGHLIEDADDDVRYNAAIGLARQGADAAWKPLEEMLALPDVVPSEGDQQGQAERYRRAMIVVNALKGVSLLVDDTKRPPPGAVTTLITKLATDPVSDVRSSAAALDRRIGRLAAGQ